MVTLRQRLEDALAEVIERERFGISFGAAAEDVSVAYGLAPEDIEEFAEEQARADVAIAAEGG